MAPAFCSIVADPDHAPVTFRDDEEIEQIGRGMCERSLPKAQWTHAAHFAATLWLIRRRGEAAVARELPQLIRAYNAATGGINDDSGGYHETITQASIRAAADFQRRDPTRPLALTCNALLLSPLGDSHWLFRYWSRERLLSVAARRGWVDPDLAPLPF